MKALQLWWLSFWMIILNKLMPLLISHGWTKAVCKQQHSVSWPGDIKISSCLSSSLTLSSVIPAVGWKQPKILLLSPGPTTHFFPTKRLGLSVLCPWPNCHNAPQPTNPPSSPQRRFKNYHHLYKTWTMATFILQTKFSSHNYIWCNLESNV